MAQSKSSPPRKTTGKSAPPAKKVAGSRPNAATRPPVKKKPGKSIVNQRQTPWGLIAVTAAIVVFAVVIVVVVVATRKDDKSSNPSAGSNVGNCSASTGDNKNTYLNENVCASKIKGIVFKPEANRNHVTAPVTDYDTTPPIGGNHSGIWADCTGTVYASAIANENAVHMLEHGAVWITYNEKTIKSGDLDKLKELVQGQDRMALSPYPNLDSPISLQAWGYQLKLTSASDPRLNEFVNDLRYNPQTTPEPNATCSDPPFKTSPSSFGHPEF